MKSNIKDLFGVAVMCALTSACNGSSPSTTSQAAALGSLPAATAQLANLNQCGQAHVTPNLDVPYEQMGDNCSISVLAKIPQKNLQERYWTSGKFASDGRLVVNNTDSFEIVSPDGKSIQLISPSTPLDSPIPGFPEATTRLAEETGLELANGNLVLKFRGGQNFELDFISTSGPLIKALVIPANMAFFSVIPYKDGAAVIAKKSSGYYIQLYSSNGQLQMESPNAVDMDDTSVGFIHDGILAVDGTTKTLIFDSSGNQVASIAKGVSPVPTDRAFWRADGSVTFYDPKNLLTYDCEGNLLRTTPIPAAGKWNKDYYPLAKEFQNGVTFFNHSQFLSAQDQVIAEVPWTTDYFLLDAPMFSTMNEVAFLHYTGDTSHPNMLVFDPSGKLVDQVDLRGTNASELGTNRGPGNSGAFYRISNHNYIFEESLGGGGAFFVGNGTQAIDPNINVYYRGPRNLFSGLVVTSRDPSGWPTSWQLALLQAQCQ